MPYLRLLRSALLAGCLILCGTSAARAQFSAQSFVSTPTTTAAQPLVLNVGQNYASALSFTITFNQLGTSIATIEMRGGLPPGLGAGGAQQGDAYVVTSRPTAVFFGTPTTPGDYHLVINAIASTGTNSLSQGAVWDVYFRVQASGTAPTITSQPSSLTVTAGANVTFTAAADGAPAPTFQWRKDGVNISGATNATLTLTAVAATSAGAYSVVATNSVGNATSNVANLTVNPLVVTTTPTITAQPISVAVTAGGTVAFTASADGNPAPTLQWRKNGAAISGATSATLLLPAVSAADAASYTLVATNSVSTATSNAAVLTLSPSTDVGRLTNLSVLSSLASRTDTFSLGYVASGATATNPKPLVIRAAGPSLGALGFPGTLDDPKLELFAGPTKTGENEDWGGSPATTAAMAAVGAFAYVSPTSRDAAVATSVTSSDNSVKITVGANSTTGAGAVIAEVYDATPAGTATASTPKLVNFSVIKSIAPNGSLTLGFTIGGSTAKTVLIRAIGPGLAVVGLTSGTLGDPQLTLFNSASVAIATNNDWAGDPAFVSSMTRVNAFAGFSTASKDAMLVLTLPPGGYTAMAAGNNGTSGLAIVEVYEVP